MTKSLSDKNTNSNSPTISQTIEKLRAFSETDVRQNWRCFAGHMTVAEVFASDFDSWETRDLNKKGHIPWEKGKKVLWLAQKIVVPQDNNGYPVAGLCLRLAVVWWADSAQVYINGSLVAEGDLFDFFQRVLLSGSVTPGEEFTVALRLVSPGHDNGALVSSKLVYEAVDNNLYPGFVAAELAILQRYYQAFAPDELDKVAAKVNTWEINPQNQGQELINQSLSSLQNYLQSQTPKIQSTIKLVGHAHLDMAWLWPVSETWEAAKNTFASVLKLQQDFPELIFCHSTPALYAWVEENCPDLFELIKKAVQNKVWEIIGAFWVEPELNVISGESIVRQLLYGQRYVKEKFGEFSPVAWLPDSFGFCWTLPQFMTSAGVEYFVTQKLIWNDTTKFPHGAFWWRSPDGSEIFSLMSAPIGEGIDPVKMVEYAIGWEKQTGLQNYLWLPGVGDHGGGPTRDMLEVSRRWESSSICPEFEFTTVENYLDEIKQQGEIETSPASKFPTWNDELYLEFHRGCYTTHGDQKLFNRRGEKLLYEAELFASLASICCGIDYPKAEIEGAWKKLLFNQFHDILPGSSIVEVYQDAQPEWEQMQNTASKILHQSLQTLSNQIKLPQPPQPDSLPVITFNSLNWLRSEVVSVSLPATTATKNQQWQVYDSSGNQIASQLDAESNLLFLATDIPSVGYRLYWLSPISETLSQNDSKTIALQFSEEISSQNDSKTIALQFSEEISSQNDSKTIALQFSEEIPSQNDSKTIALQFSEEIPSQNDSKTIALQFILENEFLKVVVNKETGDLSSVFDKLNHREILGASGNQLQAFTDEGQYWDAWNIDPNYESNILPPLKLKSIEWKEQGLIQNRLRVVRQLGESEFTQDYILQIDSPVLKITTKVNWLERHTLVKAAFPLNLEAATATYEIPCGVIQRTTKPQTPAEKAKWEVPALHWADLTEEDSYGVSLLNDCKYGYDAQPSQLRLSLLRSPEWPNPQADKGNHEFSYGLYPHAGNWEKAQTVKRGYEFNQPIITVLCEQKSQTETLPSEASFIDISSQNSCQNLILMGFKQAEDNPQQWILRCYECNGQTAEFQFTNNIGLKIKESVDLLERPQPTSFTIKPWKIASFTASS